MPVWSVVLVCAVLGAAAGAGSRVLLGRLRRGTVVRPGPLEASAAVIAGGAAVLTWPSGPWLPALWIGLLAVPLTAVDIRHHRLPDALTLPAVPVTFGVCAVDQLSGGAGSLGRALAAGLLVGGLFLLVVTVAPTAMGRGDAKLSFTIGIALGYLSWPAVWVGLFTGFLAGSVIGLVLLVTRRGGLRTAIPFGPALLLGCWLVVTVPAATGGLSPGTAAASAANVAP